VLVGDATGAEQLAEGLRPEEVALDLVLEIGLPVEPDRSRDVRLGVQRRVLVDFDDRMLSSSRWSCTHWVSTRTSFA
jgi:hypothetical protein